jgi:hypothetical protein
LIVDELQTREKDGRVERSARLRWVGGEFRLSIEVPEGFEPPEEDATAFLLVALPLALYRGEDLQVDGSVSAQTLRQTERIQAIYAAWDSEVRRCRVRVAAEAPVRAAAPGHGCLLSRGVDSMYSATTTDAAPLTHLVFCDTLAPLQNEQVRGEELRIVSAIADLIDLPVLRISTNLRDPGAQLIDYQDMHGAGIAFMAHSLSGGLGRMVVPSGLTYAVASPAGSHPLLDPLFGSEWLTFHHHGLELGRPGKIAKLVEDRSELLQYLKVCFGEDSAANCGRCRKCLWTMIALKAAGGLRHASLFPDEIDIDALSQLRIVDLPLRLFWMQAAESLGDRPEDRRVRDAVRHVLRRSARPSLRERVRGVLAWSKRESEHIEPYWSVSPSAQFRNHTNVAIAALRAGVPYRFGIESAVPQPTPAWSVGPLEPAWGPPLEASTSLVGLLRLLDRRGRAHRYAAGVMPPIVGAERVGELGALLCEPISNGIPVWIAPDGRLGTDRHAPLPSDLHPRVVARWALAPVLWKRLASPVPRLNEVVTRVLEAFAAFRRAPANVWNITGEPAGYLFRGDGEGRLPLFSAIHPVTGDQLLSTDGRESVDLGYNAPTLLGFLAAVAPASATLGTARPLVPWASRFGRRTSGSE